MIYQDIDEQFFKVIDSEAKAYALGFLYADGNVSHNLHSLTLKLHKQDVDILQKIKNFLSPSSPIKNIKDKYCYFRINRKSVCQQLIQLGCTPKKSLTLQFPSLNQVPEHLLPSFLRGYSDGDGSITSYQLSPKRKSFAWTIVSTQSFCQQVAQLLKQKLNINCHLKTTDRSNKNTITQTLSVGGSLQLSKLLDWLYQDSTIHMERKYQKYSQFKKEINSKPFHKKIIARGSFKINQQMAISLYLGGNSKRKVAQIMNCDVKSIYSILKKNKIVTIKSNSYLKEKSISSKGKEIIWLYNNGTSVKDIAKKFVCTSTNITIILNKNGIKVNNRKQLTEDEINKILSLRNDGMGSAKIAKQMGYNKSFIVRFLRKHK